MRPVRFELSGHRSVDWLSFDAGRLTVLFGKNNAGKTNIVEAVYGLLSGDTSKFRPAANSRDTHLFGGLWVELEQGDRYDDAVAVALGVDISEPGPHYARIGGRSLFVGDPHGLASIDEPDSVDEMWDGLRVAEVEGPRPHVILLDWKFENLHEPFGECAAGLASRSPDSPNRWAWLESVGDAAGEIRYRVPKELEKAVRDLAELTTDLLPDFVEGSVRAHVTSPTLWDRFPKVILEFEERGATQCADVVELAGSGAARWIAAAVQMAIHLMSENPTLTALRPAENRFLSGHVILLDEPEAHLHPSAVASVRRWCHRMVRHGATVVAASHHEEFLRSAGDDLTLVHVTRDEDMVRSRARALSSNAVPVLRELAIDIGMHPAAALSLHRAVLFVEGPLDVAVLDEFAGLHLDAVGVMLVPVHGTKNLEGLVTGEVVTRLGLAIGILTDATDPLTMGERSRRRLSSEEKKVLRIVELSEAQGLQTPRCFGVEEDDLLFAMPRAGVIDYLGRDFPEWRDLIREAREAVGASPSESVNWKQFALERYGLPIIDPEGVREVVRALDLAGVAMPSLTQVVDEVTAWVRSA